MAIEGGCDVSLAGIEFTDPRYAGKFDRFPFRHAVLDLLAVLPAQVRRSLIVNPPPVRHERGRWPGRPYKYVTIVRSSAELA